MCVALTVSEEPEEDVLPKQGKVKHLSNHEIYLEFVFLLSPFVVFVAIALNLIEF